MSGFSVLTLQSFRSNEIELWFNMSVWLEHLRGDWGLNEMGACN